MINLKIGKLYSRNQILDLLEVPKNSNGNRGGVYTTGYFKYDDAYYVFTNIGVAGRTGHDYDNKFIEDDKLYWFAKTHTKLSQNQIVDLINPDTKVHIFYRENDRDNFIYAGLGKPIDYQASTDKLPVQITWQLLSK